jgi:toxin ParE1/3/4
MKSIMPDRSLGPGAVSPLTSGMKPSLLPSSRHNSTAAKAADHPKAEAELDRLYGDIALEAGDRIAGDYVDGVITFIESLEAFPERGTVRESRIPGLRIIGYRRSVSVAFSVREDDVLILGVFARGRDINDEILEDRDQ